MMQLTCGTVKFRRFVFRNTNPFSSISTLDSLPRLFRRFLWCRLDEDDDEVVFVSTSLSSDLGVSKYVNDRASVARDRRKPILLNRTQSTAKTRNSKMTLRHSDTDKLKNEMWSGERASAQRATANQSAKTQWSSAQSPGVAHCGPTVGLFSAAPEPEDIKSCRGECRHFICHYFNEKLGQRIKKM